MEKEEQAYISAHEYVQELSQKSIGATLDSSEVTESSATLGMVVPLIVVSAIIGVFFFFYQMIKNK